MHSFKSKMLFLILGILIITTFIFLIFTQKEVERAMLNAARDAARNMLHLVKLNVENEYQSLLYHKEYALVRYKEQLQNVVGIVESHLDSYYEMFEKGIINEAEAQQLALKSVEKFRFGKNDYFYIYDLELHAISHPDLNIRGKDMSNYLDVNGQLILQNIKKTLLQDEKGFDSFWHIRLGEKKPVEKLSFNVLYKKWNWIIGSGVYIDDIEADERAKLSKIISDLKQTFSKIKIGETGYFYIFNGEKFMLIHPSLADQDVTGLKDPVTGSDHIDDLIIASNNPEEPFSYIWDKPPLFENEFRFKKESFIEHFKHLDWYIASSVYEDEMRLPAKVIIKRQIAISLLILFISVFVIMILVKRFTKPLKTLTVHAKNLASSDFSPTSKEGLKQISKHSKDEMGKLADAFIYMQNTLQDYIQNLKITTAANEKIKSELQIARNIQMEMVPKDFPAFPARTEIDIFAFIEPAKDVGGDLYDYFFIDEENLCFLIGDVSDKGVPAALFMARSISLIRATTTLMKKNSRIEILPGTILDEVNKELYRDNEMCMFVTLFMGILNTRTGKIDYSNAGHNPPYLLKNNKIIQLDKICGCPLGIKKRTNYKSYSFILEYYDCLFLYTDGITEAMDKNDNEFSEKRLEENLNQIQTESPKQIITKIVKEVKEFSANIPQSDDISALAIKYFGNEAKIEKDSISIVLKNQIDEVEKLKERAEKFFRKHKINDNIQFDLTLALEEIFINIVSYAFEDNSKHDIEVVINLGEMIKIEVKDDGKPFNPIAGTKEAFDEPKKIGGKGLKLVKKLVDELKYQRIENRNVLTIKKHLK
ncbi:MAG: cache domain-containing protein [Armatimonadetes bacterium]|nr:cache domain-containing protein [Armatimonadota bacterium]